MIYTLLLTNRKVQHSTPLYHWVASENYAIVRDRKSAIFQRFLHLKLRFFDPLANIITRVPISMHTGTNFLMPRFSFGCSEQYHERDKI